MRKLFWFSYSCLVLAAILGLTIRTSSYIVSAQDAPQNAPKPAATPAPVIETKAKPVILDKDQLLILNNLELRQENARLRAEAAIPQTIKDEMKAIGTEMDEFWKARGIKREELQTKWNANKGVDGAIILTPVEEKKVAVTPEKK